MPRVAFLGSKRLGLRILQCLLNTDPSCEWVVVHPDDSKDGRTALDAFRAFTEERGLNLRVVLSGSATKTVLQSLKPDIVFVCGWYWLIDNETLAEVPRGFYGIHNSLLPKYRGGSPLVWSIINGEPETGASLFRFGSGMDDGPVVHLERVTLLENDTIATVLEKLADGLLFSLPAIWRGLLDGTAVLTPQNEAEATYCGQRIAEDGRIDWARPARAVHNFIRAQVPPYPGAFTFINGKKAVFLKTEVENNRLYYGTPGQVLQRRPEGVLVACGNATTLNVLELAVDGELISSNKVLTSLSTRLR
jgi:methionyl-tRNA formyltransferase